MGFTEFEKHQIARLTRHDTDIMMENDLPKPYYRYLKSQNLLVALEDKVNLNAFNFYARINILNIY